MKKKISVAIASIVLMQTANAEVIKGEYIVKNGDSLWTISKHLTGKGSVWKHVFKDDPIVNSPEKLKPKYILKYAFDNGHSEELKPVLKDSPLPQKINQLKFNSVGSDIEKSKDDAKTNVSNDFVELNPHNVSRSGEGHQFPENYRENLGDLELINVDKEDSISTEAIVEIDDQIPTFVEDKNYIEVAAEIQLSINEVPQVDLEQIDMNSSDVSELDFTDSNDEVEQIEEEQVEVGTAERIMKGDNLVLNDSSIYTVVKGDTLWDIAGKFTNDPYKWTEIWAKNSYIENPDLIYPGDKVAINFVNGIPVISINDKPLFDVKNAVEKKEVGPKIVKINKELTSFLGHDLKILNQFIENFRFYAPDEAMNISDVYLTENMLLATIGDKVYLESKSFVGERYEVVKVLGKSFDSKGSLQSVVGERVADVSLGNKLGDLASGLIGESSGAVKEGLQAFPEKDPIRFENIKVRSSKEVVEGEIDSLLDHVSNSAQYDIVSVSYDTIKETPGVGILVNVFKEEKVKQGFLKSLFSKKTEEINVADGVVIESFRNKAYILILNSKDRVMNGYKVKTSVKS